MLSPLQGGRMNVKGFLFGVILMGTALSLVQCDPPRPVPIAPSQADQGHGKVGMPERDR